MSFVDNELEAGEEIVFKINRERKFNHYYKTISQACITFPLIAYFIWKYFPLFLLTSLNLHLSIQSLCRCCFPFVYQVLYMAQHSRLSLLPFWI